MEQFIRDNIPPMPEFLIIIIITALVLFVIGNVIYNEYPKDKTGLVVQTLSLATILISISSWTYLRQETLHNPDSVALYRTEKQVILKSYSPMIQSKRFDIASEEPGKVYINMAGKRYELEATQLKEY